MEGGVLCASDRAESNQGHAEGEDRDAGEDPYKTFVLQRAGHDEFLLPALLENGDRLGIIKVSAAILPDFDSAISICLQVLESAE